MLTARVERFCGALRRSNLAPSFLLQAFLISTAAPLVPGAVVHGLTQEGLIFGGGSEDMKQQLVSARNVLLPGSTAAQQCIAARELASTRYRRQL